MDALAFLEQRERAALEPVYVLHGDEDFLKRQALEAIRVAALGADGHEFGFSTYRGEEATWAAVRGELETLPFLARRRVVAVDAADAFVTRHRAALEEYVSRPAPTGVLVLDVKSWPATTRLARLLSAAGSVECKSPKPAVLKGWCVRRARDRYGKKLAAPATALLVDLAGTDMGLLDQELAKLAVYVGTSARIEEADVDKLVGQSRVENTFQILDRVVAGRPSEALEILGRLFDEGDDPIRILGGLGYQLRSAAQVARLCKQGESVRSAADRLRVPGFARQRLEQLLRHLGPRRADRLFDWLLEVDWGLKGGSPLSPRVQLERLAARLVERYTAPDRGPADRRAWR